jgi:hypothetical protein
MNQCFVSYVSAIPPDGAYHSFGFGFYKEAAPTALGFNNLIPARGSRNFTFRVESESMGR